MNEAQREAIRGFRTAFNQAISTANGKALALGHDPHPWKRNDGYAASTGCRVCGAGAIVTVTASSTGITGSLVTEACKR